MKLPLVLHAFAGSLITALGACEDHADSMSDA
jgi:hypothetical protein